MYREGIEELDLYIERGTERVPDDDRFHILDSGSPLGSFAMLADAQRYLAQLAARRGWQDPAASEITPGDRLRAEQAERFLRDSYRDKKTRATRRGGRGGRGGV